MTENEPARLLAVCTVHALRSDAGQVGITAIDKRPAAGPVKVRTLGLWADIQADRHNHGGESKALYAYAQEDAEYWSARLGRQIVPGLFGENLRTAGLDVNAAMIGERWRIGPSVDVEVTCPRTPCATFGRYMDEPHWVRRFTEEGRIGAYLRVCRTGTITAGDPIRISRRPTHGVSVGTWFSARDRAAAAALLTAQDAGELSLVPEMLASIDQTLRPALRPDLRRLARGS